MSAICFAPTIGWASDVDYQLDNRALEMILRARNWLAADLSEEISETRATVPAEATAKKLEKPFSGELVKDRVWDLKGIEERASFAEREAAEGFGRDRPVTIQPSSKAAHASYSIDASDSAAHAPEWIDDGLWPKTKDLLHYKNEPRALPRVTETISFFEPPVMVTSKVNIRD